MNISANSRSGLTIGVCLLAIASFLMTATTPGSALAASTSSTMGSSSVKDIRAQANVYFEKGLRYQKQDKFKMAEAQYRKAVRMDPQYAEAYSNLGFSLRKQGAYDEAVRNYQKAIELDDQLAEAYEYLGEAYAEMGRFDLAERQLGKLRNLRSEEAEALSAFIMKKKGQ